MNPRLDTRADGFWILASALRLLTLPNSFQRQTPGRDSHPLWAHFVKTSTLIWTEGCMPFSPLLRFMQTQRVGLHLCQKVSELSAKRGQTFWRPRAPCPCPIFPPVLYAGDEVPGLAAKVQLSQALRLLMAALGANRCVSKRRKRNVNVKMAAGDTGVRLLANKHRRCSESRKRFCRAKVAPRPEGKNRRSFLKAKPPLSPALMCLRTLKKGTLRLRTHGLA